MWDLQKSIIQRKYPGFYRFIRSVLHSGQSSPLVYNCRNYTSNDFVRNLLQVLVTPYCALKYFHVRDIPGREGLAFVLIAKNEAPYIEEWINFHHKQGVSHFIIYDNESTDNLHEVLKPYIESGLVTYNFIPGKIRQPDAYSMAAANYRHKFKYMGFIDADEFVFVRKNIYGGGGYNLYEFVDGFMNSHKNAGGIGINWCMFGSSGYETKPEGGVLKNFTRCAEKNFEANHSTKTICDPMKVFVYASVHFPFYRKGFYNLNEKGEVLDWVCSKEVNFEYIRVNHYYLKSREEFLQKRNRGLADSRVDLLPLDAFEHNDKNDILDTEILSRL